MTDMTGMQHFQWEVAQLTLLHLQRWLGYVGVQQMPQGLQQGLLPPSQQHCAVHAE